MFYIGPMYRKIIYSDGQKSFVHFSSIWLWPHWGTGVNFGTGRFCELESYICLIFSKKISLTVSHSESVKDISSEKIRPPPMWGPQKIPEKIRKSFAHHCISFNAKNSLRQCLTILARYEAKIAKICNFWTFRLAKSPFVGF